MEKPTDQVWLPIPGWEDLYEVSSLGLVWSHQSKRGKKGGLLKTPPDARGYPQVNLSRLGMPRPLHMTVHVLVATAFHGPCPPRMECRHLDGNKTNNFASNLAWGTSTENNYDLVRHGTHYTKYRNATHCIHGHEFTPENTQLTERNGGIRRDCITCIKRRSREKNARRTARRRAAALVDRLLREGG